MRTRNLARIVIGGVILAVCQVIVGCGPIQWQTSYDKGMRQAMEQRRRVLLEFVSRVSPDCTEMDMRVFSDAEVQKLMQKFVAVRLDTMFDKELTRYFNVQATPSFYVIRPDGQVVAAHSGKMDAEKFRVFLIKSSYN
jgi:thioredoxin-related protein